jgi:hypothetical protein
MVSISMESEMLMGISIFKTGMNESDGQEESQTWLMKQDLSKLDPENLTPLTEEVIIIDIYSYNSNILYD